MFMERRARVGAHAQCDKSGSIKLVKIASLRAFNLLADSIIRKAALHVLAGTSRGRLFGFLPTEDGETPACFAKRTTSRASALVSPGTVRHRRRSRFLWGRIDLRAAIEGEREIERERGREGGRKRGEGKPRAFSGITLWQAADVHPCSLSPPFPFPPLVCLPPIPLSPPRLDALSSSLFYGLIAPETPSPVYLP